MEDFMFTLTRPRIVILGYVAAFVVALAAFCVLTMIEDPLTSGVMNDFGNLILCGALFGFLSIIPSGLALYYLRPFPKFWSVLGAVSVAFAITGPLAAVMLRRFDGPGWQGMVGFFSLMRMFGAPVLAAAFVVGAIIAPRWKVRWALLSSSAVECVVAGYAFVCLFVLKHWLL